MKPWILLICVLLDEGSLSNAVYAEFDLCSTPGRCTDRFVCVQHSNTQVGCTCPEQKSIIDGLCVKVLSQANIALKRPAMQSCDYTGAGFTAPAAWAVDGNNNTNFYQKACAHTCDEVNPWWEVDLGQNYNVKSVAITRRGDNPNLGPRLSNLIFEVSMERGATGDHTNLHVCYSVHNNAPPLGKRTSFPCRQGTVGRYLRIQLIGRTWLTLCEVEVFGIPLSNDVSSENRALGRPAKQSCEFVGLGFPTPARLAVDGNGNPQVIGESCALTCAERNPWWEVDLGQIYNVESVAITRRATYYLEVWQIRYRIELFVESDDQPKDASLCYEMPNTEPSHGLRKSFTCHQGAVGRYLRIQGLGLNGLTLCEVEVFGVPLRE